MAKWTTDCIATEMAEVDRVIDGVCSSDNRRLSEMCHYVLDNHGKRVRPAVLILAYKAVGGKDTDTAVNVAQAFEIVHNATLIHDDINDGGDLRRGARALYKQYSLSKSIVAGDYLYAKAFGLVGTTQSKVIEYLIDAQAGLANGEFDQGDYEHNTAVTGDDYINIVRNKTGGLFEAAAKVGVYLADPENVGAIEALGNFAINAGIAFQIVDDLLDEIGDPTVTGKRTGNDIVDGKPTLPIIYAMEDPSVGDRVSRIFSDPETDYDKASEAIGLILSTDQPERCYRLAEEYASKARSYLDQIPPSEFRDTLGSMVDFIIARDR